MKKTFLALAFATISIQAANAADIAPTQIKPPAAAEPIHSGAGSATAAEEAKRRIDRAAARLAHEAAETKDKSTLADKSNGDLPKPKDPAGSPPPPRQEPPRHAPDTTPATPVTPSVGSSVKIDASPTHSAQSQAPARTGKK